MTTFFAVTALPPTSTVCASVNSARPLSQVDLVLLEQELDPAGQLLDRVGLLLLQPAEVERDLAGLDAQLRQRAVRRFLEQLGAVQQRLRRNAPDVEASPAQRLAALRAGGLQPELRRADRRDIAAGPEPMTRTS